jgi:hypothetical protein
MILFSSRQEEEELLTLPLSPLTYAFSKPDAIGLLFSRLSFLSQRGFGFSSTITHYLSLKPSACALPNPTLTLLPPQRFPGRRHRTPIRLTKSSPRVRRVHRHLDVPGLR